MNTTTPGQSVAAIGCESGENCRYGATRLRVGRRVQIGAGISL